MLSKKEKVKFVTAKHYFLIFSSVSMDEEEMLWLAAIVDSIRRCDAGF